MNFDDLGPRKHYESMDELIEHFGQYAEFVEKEGTFLETLVVAVVASALTQLEQTLDELTRQNPDKTRNEIFREQILPIWKEQLEKSEDISPI